MLQLPTKFSVVGFVPVMALTLLPTVSGAIAPSRFDQSPQLQSAAGVPVLVAQQNRTRRIQFKAGESSAIVRDAVIRGTRDTYLLGAQKGQTMTVKIESLENNAVFDVVAPPNSAGRRLALKQEAVSWSGKLPASGDYQIVVGGTRGNASYKLQVAIR